jgi:acyl-CoA synthetase
VLPFLTLHHPARARQYYDAGYWRGDTFYSLLAGLADTNPDRIAARDGRSRLTWAEVRDAVDNIAWTLRADGLVSGNRVAVWLPNRLDAVFAFLACSRQGYACNPSLHRTHTVADVARLLNRLSAAALITVPGSGADDAAIEVESLRKDVPSLTGIYRFEDLATSERKDLPPPETDPDKVVYLAFTSGTTGIPKCVMHSDNTLLANARDLVADWRLTAETKILTLSPLSHHIAWIAVSQWLLCGGELIVDDPPAGASRLDWIIETEATYVLGVPTHAIDILEEQSRRGIRRLGRVETFYMAGSPIPPSVAAAFVEQGIRPQNVYGMTENSSHQYTHPDDDTEVVTSSCGRGGRAYEVRLFDVADPDKPAAPGAEGQIGGRGASLMLGYFDDQGATERSFNRDGWFLSGDLGRLDARCNLAVSGRLKDLIIRGGHNIYPAHIEALALRSPLVQKCAVVPVPDTRLGERACIVVTGPIASEALIEHLREMGLSKYDMPEFFLRVDALPTTPSGKILKRDLAERIRDGSLVPDPVLRRRKAS